MFDTYCNQSTYDSQIIDGILLQLYVKQLYLTKTIWKTEFDVRIMLNITRLQRRLAQRCVLSCKVSERSHKTKPHNISSEYFSRIIQGKNRSEINEDKNHVIQYTISRDISSPVVNPTEIFAGELCSKFGERGRTVRTPAAPSKPSTPVKPCLFTT